VPELFILSPIPDSVKLKVVPGFPSNVTREMRPSDVAFMLSRGNARAALATDKMMAVFTINMVTCDVDGIRE